MTRNHASSISSFCALIIPSLMCISAQATPITFAPGDYDNTANTVTTGPTTNYLQTTGKFRDVIWWSLNNNQPTVGSGDYINSGNSLVLVNNHAAPGSGPFTALNFTGPAINGGQSYLSIYDTTPADGAASKNVFNAAAGLTISADVLFAETSHSASGGVVALYNEGQDGLALLLSNGGGNNPDIPKLSLVWQSPGAGLTLQSVNLGAGGAAIATGNWYRVTMALTVSGDSWTSNGTFRNHVNGLDPTSALSSTITTLNFTGSLLNSDPSPLVLSNPGEIGVLAMGNNVALPDNVGVSITNFNFVPEPASLTLAGVGLLGMAGYAVARRRKQGRALRGN